MDAAARLEYVTSVQARTRRAALAPSFALVLLGALVLVHGAFATVWPHAALITITWLAAIIAIRPVLLWLRRRLEYSRRLYGSLRLRLGVGAAGLAAAAVAIAFGGSPFLASIAAAWTRRSTSPPGWGSSPRCARPSGWTSYRCATCSTSRTATCRATSRRWRTPATSTEKTFEGRKPRTWISATKPGRKALAQQIATLREIVAAAEPRRAPRRRAAEA